LSSDATKLNEQKLDAEAANGSEVTSDYDLRSVITVKENNLICIIKYQV